MKRAFVFFKSLGYTYKTIRKELYEPKIESLKEGETLSTQGCIDLYYGDETAVSTEGYCPYGWQGKEEKVAVASLPISPQRLNGFGWISRSNPFHYATPTLPIEGTLFLSTWKPFPRTYKSLLL